MLLASCMKIASILVQYASYWIKRQRPSMSTTCKANNVMIISCRSLWKTRIFDRLWCWYRTLDNDTLWGHHTLKSHYFHLRTKLSPH
jgi:hypothetical protein